MDNWDSRFEQHSPLITYAQIAITVASYILIALAQLRRKKARA
jgi:hypothetical protein